MYSDSHANFNELTTAKIQDQFRAFEERTFKALGDKISTYESILTFFQFSLVLTLVPPYSYFRPPGLNCNKHCLEVTKSMGYHVVTLNSDPSDWKNPNNMTASKQYFDHEFATCENGQSYITVVDDSIDLTVDDLIPYVIKLAKNRGYRRKFPLAMLLSYTMLGL
jgi:peptidoglycan/xylan/chitin deacetylase (PgdA/CDA1 family)